MLLYILNDFLFLWLKSWIQQPMVKPVAHDPLEISHFLKWILKQFCCFVEIKQVQQKSTKKNVNFDQGSMHPYLLKSFKL